MTSRHVAINQRRGNRFGEGMGLLNLGYGYASLGQYQLASETLQRSIDLMEAMGARRMSAYGRLNLGLSYLRGGDYQNAIRTLESALPDLLAAGDDYGAAAQRVYLGLTFEQLGEMASAERCFVEAKTRYHETGALGYEIDTLAGLARCQMALKDLEGAKQSANQVWNHLEGNDPSTLEFPILGFLTCAEVFSTLGEADKSAAVIRAGYLELGAQANRISDAEWRQSFLENVPEHSTIIKLYGQSQARLIQ
jgi:tetratricopeptide (TPR) repeat protein